MNRIFYSAYVLYVVATVLQSTMFTQYALLAKVFAIMRYISFGVAGVKIAVDLYSQYSLENKSKIGLIRRTSTKKFIGYLALMILLGIASLVTDDRTLLFVSVLLIASQGIEFDEIAWKTLWLQSILMGIIVVSSSFNIIPDLLFKRDDIPIRHALGYTYPSVMVTSCLFIFLLYLWLKNSSLSNQEFAAAEIFNFLVYKLTDSRMGFLTFGVIAAILWMIGKNPILGWVQKAEFRVGNKVKKFGGNIYDYLAVYLSAGLFLLCITMPLSITQLINSLLTDRIRLTANAIRNYGIHLFGNNIEWIGFGGSTDTDSLLASYNFVDSSYGYILVNFGIIIFCITIFLFVICSKYLRRTEGKIRCFIFGIVLLYCFIEPRLLEVHVNTFLFLLVPALTEFINKYANNKTNRKALL